MNVIAPAYAADGVNLAEGDSFSSFCGNICRQSYRNSSFVTVNDWAQGKFRGPRTFRLQAHLSPELEFSGDPDGNGTKVILNVAANQPKWSAADLFAMTGMDAVRYGGRNVVLFNQLDVSSLGQHYDYDANTFFRDLIEGLANIAREQGVVLFKGETAETGVCVASENPRAHIKYLWCGVMISVFHPCNFITGDTLAEGQVAIALREYGLRANGGSSARKALSLRYGEGWYDNQDAHQDITAASAPSVLYENFLSSLNGWDALDLAGRPMPRIKVHAIAHITGGGIPSKLFLDYLKPKGFSAVLDNLWKPPEIMRKLADWRGVSGKEPYEIWHGGQGAIVVIDPGDVPNFCRLARLAGHEAQPAGLITKRGTPALVISSKFPDRQTLVWQ